MINVIGRIKLDGNQIFKIVLTFTLKKGATFQDGSPIEAKDVVWSVERLLAINEGPSYLFSNSDW